MEMYYYLDSANKQCGPVAADQLALHGVNAQSYVWREGMSEWKRACELPELTPYLTGQTTPPNAGAAQPQYAPGMQQPYGVAPAPSSNLVFAILTTIFCCLPTGLYAVICAAKVDTLWLAGRYDEARQMSKNAALWSWIGFGLSFALWVIYSLVATVPFWALARGI